jgi:dinuclear metal center YbgI/SA1388 family protein
MSDLEESLCKLAPLHLAEKWDNVGLMIGSSSASITKVLCALDINDAVIDEAIETGVECIVTHHPFFFKEIKKIDYNTPKGALIQKIIQNGLHIYSMHTNLDIAKGGINDLLADKLVLKNKSVLFQTDPLTNEGIGRVGEIEPLTLKTLATQMKTILDTPHVRVVGALEKQVTRVAICSGSGSEYLMVAAQKADVYITGDLKFHEAQQAIEQGLCLIDAGHYPLETIMMPVLANYINHTLEGIVAIPSKINGEMFQTI